MSETRHKKRINLSPRARVIVALAVIALMVLVVVFLFPRERDSTIVVGDTVGPTVTATNFVGTLVVNRSFDFNSVHYTVARVTQASAFSDDHKLAGVYTVRVDVQANSDSSLQNPIGINYPSLVRLILPDGQSISPKLVSLAPLFLPGGSQRGFFDFPVNSQVVLSTLVLKMGNETTVAFS
ncbi:MAG TPA: hypothetical protein VEH81_14875 [Ktedonobacteraceae bacterium]|nr:hypothetical protein [Ktedonobacteraceae bacterium]